MSKYSTIADKLKEEIEQGKYSAAGKLPTEYELVTRFNVSRQTVRQAILSLKADGVVYQVQGSGTYISKDTSPARKVTGSSFKNIFVICTYISEYIFPSIIRIDETVATKRRSSTSLTSIGPAASNSAIWTPCRRKRAAR